MTTLMIKDLSLTEELDRSAMAAVHGGRPVGAQRGEHECRTGPHGDRRVLVTVDVLTGQRDEQATQDLLAGVDEAHRRIVRGELDGYGAGLTDKPEIIALTKADLLDAKQRDKLVKALPATSSWTLWSPFFVAPS